MSWFVKSQDLLIIFIVPLMVATFVDIKRNWSALWDDNVTKQDRELLMRFTIFLLLPIAVFLHELGHALATVSFGGKIAEFHYGILWGYVVPQGSFSPLEILGIYLAGNLVEVLIGLLALLLTLFVRSPAAVTVLTYFGLWTIGATLVLYPALSIAGMYGDWSAIYTSPLTSCKLIIAIVHLLLISLLGLAIYGKASRLWFVRRTDPVWDHAYCQLTQQLTNSGEPKDYLSLAWLFFEAGLYAHAQQFVNKFLSLSSSNSESGLLQGLLLQSQGKIEQARTILDEVVANEHLSPSLAARAAEALAQLKTTHLQQ